MAFVRRATFLPVSREVVDALIRQHSEAELKEILWALPNDAFTALLTLMHLGIERITSPDDCFSARDVCEKFASLLTQCDSDPQLARHAFVEKHLQLADHLIRGLQAIDEADVHLTPLEEYWAANHQNSRLPGPPVFVAAETSIAPAQRDEHISRSSPSPFTCDTPVVATAEQRAILEAASTASGTAVLKTIAKAGTGKTTLCEFIGEERRAMRMIYVAFNRIMDEHARNRLGHLMTCRTIDGLAYSVVNPCRIWGDVRVRPGTRCDWAALGDTLGLPLTFGGFKRRTLAQLVYQTVMNYCYSADPEINAHHIAGADWPSGSEQILQRWASDLWHRMLSTNENIPVPPPQVMKYWHLSGSTIPYDLVLFDEAQDANPAFMAIVDRSPCQRNLIGDPDQQLYEWRGAVDAMSLIDGTSFPLTQSWRFGARIADFAHATIASKSRPPLHRISGNPGIASKVAIYDVGRGLPEWPVTILARTNAQVFRGAVDIAERGHRLHVVGDIKGLRWLLLEALSLFRGDDMPRTHWQIACFRSWDDLVAEAEITADRELKRIRDIVETRHDVLERQLDTLRRYHQADARSAEAILATTHRVKGREWDRVMLLDDFIKPAEYANLPADRRDAELNVLYVAATRARFELYVPRVICPPGWS